MKKHDSSKGSEVSVNRGTPDSYYEAAAAKLTLSKIHKAARREFKRLSQNQIEITAPKS